MRAATAVARSRAAESVSTPVLVGALTLALMVVLVASAGVGAVRISFAEVVRALLNPSQETDASVILYSLRLPRVISAALVGAALSATGVLFQGLFRNALADPFVLGASGGAALGAAIAVFVFPAMSVAGMSGSALFAFAGALLTMVLVWVVASGGGPGRVENMLLAGFAIGTMLNATTSALEFTHDGARTGVRILTVWLYGQVGAPPWPQIGAAALLIIGIIATAMPLARTLNTLALGEDYALQLGVPVQRVRALVLIVGALLTALAVSLGGLIGFVGLLIPHVLRILIGPEHFRLLPTSAITGAIFLVVADTVARSAFAPSEVPVGILTAFLGGPVFLYLLNRRRAA